MVEIAVQLFTLKELDEQPWELIERVGNTAFSGVELYDPQFDALAGDGSDRCRDVLDETGLDTIGGHVRIERLEERREETLAACRRLDIDRLVIPTYETEAFATEEGVEGAAARLSDLAADLAPEGIELLYHNHTFEFGDVGGRTAFEVFVDAADDALGFEPDTGLARHAGYDPTDLLELVGGRAPLVHLTDTEASSDDEIHVDPGYGIVDVEACAALTRRSGAEWLIYENGRTTTPLDSLDYSADRFAAFID